MIPRRYRTSVLERFAPHAFHLLYYERGDRTWQTSHWLGTQTSKCPIDLWIYQEILHELRPDVIVECGTFNGGSALFLSTMCDLLAHGEVITIDVEDRNPPQHPRLTHLLGSSTAPDIVEDVKRRVAGRDAIVLLDSDHSREHVLAELEAYADLVPVGGYVIVEDTNVNGHPAAPWFGPGPMEAVDAFLSARTDFEVDAWRERHYLTMNPRGFLKRVSPPASRDD